MERTGNSKAPLRWAATALLLFVLSAIGLPAGQDPSCVNCPDRISDRSVIPLSQRNVLLLIADDVGVEQVPVYVDYYNSNATTADDITPTPPAMPTIESLAAAGVTFLNAWSSPMCSPTRAGIYTGTYASHNGVLVADDDLDASATTIADVLSLVSYKAGTASTDRSAASWRTTGSG